MAVVDRLFEENFTQINRLNVTAGSMVMLEIF